MNQTISALKEALQSASNLRGAQMKEAKALIRSYFPPKSYLTKQEVAEMLNCSIRQVDYLRENYGLPWMCFGETIRFDANDLQAWLESQKQTGPGCVPSLAKNKIAERRTK